MLYSASMTRIKRYSPGRPSSSESKLRIERLLDITTEVFLKNGYESTSVGAIAKLAGASKQTLYSRYHSKADLFKAMMLRMSEGPLKRVGSALFSNRPLVEVLETFALEIVNLMLEPDHARFQHMAIAHLNSFPELTRMAWELGPKRGLEMLTDYLRSQMEQGVLAAGDPAMAARIFFALCQGPFFSYSQMGIRPLPTSEERHAYVREALRVFLSAHAPMESGKGLAQDSRSSAQASAPSA
jgi:TetR/AcrR family transcriptional regulator, mexJK operon transcriptional repressor